MSFSLPVALASATMAMTAVAVRAVPARIAPQFTESLFSSAGFCAVSSELSEKRYAVVVSRTCAILFIVSIEGLRSPESHRLTVKMVRIYICATGEFCGCEAGGMNRGGDGGLLSKGCFWSSGTVIFCLVMIKCTMFSDLDCADIKENNLLKIDRSPLEILLQDKTTGKNIIWATDNYAKRGDAYSADKEIKIELITGANSGIIKPRTAKSKEEQQQRVRQKAEVFTPSWICNAQNNLADESWFGWKNVFNRETEKSWGTVRDTIHFLDEKGKTWRDYVCSTRLEITCGEAPYLTSRYDAVTGEMIAVKDRIGLLDRKLRVVGENTESREAWLEWATVAVQNIYGFEWQGDNLLIARENVLLDVIEHFAEKFGTTDGACEIPREQLERFAEIISWNLWQMDGLKCVVPNSCCTETKTEETLFETIVISKPCEGCKIGYGQKSWFKHNGIYCNIMDWKTGKIERFVDSLNGENAK